MRIWSSSISIRDFSSSSRGAVRKSIWILVAAAISCNSSSEGATTSIQQPFSSLSISNSSKPASVLLTTLYIVVSLLPFQKRDKHRLPALERHLLARRTPSTPSLHKFVPPCYTALLTLLYCLLMYFLDISQNSFRELVPTACRARATTNALETGCSFFGVHAFY